MRRLQMKRIAILVILVGVVNAQIKTGTSGATFLKIGLIPRAEGMGGAFTAVANDASSVFLNPAGLAHLHSRAVFTGYTNWIANTYVPAFNIVFPIPGGANFSIFASGVQSVDFKEVTIDAQGKISITGKTFAYTAGQAGVSYSKFFTDKFATGVNLKFLYEGYGAYTSTKSFALDAGTVFYTGIKTLRIAMTLQNLGPDMQLAGKYSLYIMKGAAVITEDRTYRPYKLPMTFRLGIAIDPIDQPDVKLTISLEGINANDTDEQLAIGSEFTYLGLLSARAGYVFNKDEGGASVGLGINAGKIRLDYSFSDFGGLPDIHRIGINFSM